MKYKEAGPMVPYRLDDDATRLVNAYTLARMAKAAYADVPAEAFPQLAHDFPILDHFQEGTVFGLAAGNEKHAVLAFRGTDEPREWVEALVYGQTETPVGRVHKGIATIMDAVWQQVLAALFDVGAVDKTLWLTGHSLGGALAVLAAKRLSEEGFDVHAVYTFGAPKVLDPVAARGFNIPLYRFVNNEDAVPETYWPALFDTYAHAGELIFMLASGAIAESRHDPHLARKLDRANSIGEGILPSGMIHDHFLDSYLEKLKRLVATADR